MRNPIFPVFRSRYPVFLPQRNILHISSKLKSSPYWSSIADSLLFNVFTIMFDFLKVIFAAERNCLLLPAQRVLNAAADQIDRARKNAARGKAFKGALHRRCRKDDRQGYHPLSSEACHTAVKHAQYRKCCHKAEEAPFHFPSPLPLLFCFALTLPRVALRTFRTLSAQLKSQYTSDARCDALAFALLFAISSSPFYPSISYSSSSISSVVNPRWSSLSTISPV